MKRIYKKISLFSLLLCITLLFTINLKSVKAIGDNNDLVSIDNSTLHVNQFWNPLVRAYEYNMTGYILAGDNQIPFDTVCFNCTLTLESDEPVINVYNGTQLLASLYPGYDADLEIIDAPENSLLIYWVLQNCTIVEGGTYNNYDNLINIGNSNLFIPYNWICSSGFGVFDLECYGFYKDINEELLYLSAPIDSCDKLHIGYDYNPDNRDEIIPVSNFLIFENLDNPDYSISSSNCIFLYITESDYSNITLIRQLINMGAIICGGSYSSTPEETKTIKAGTYGFNETIIEPTFEGTFDLPTKVELELSSSDIIILNNNLSSSGLSIVVQDYLMTATYDSWKFTKDISGSTESYGEEYYIVGFNKESFNVEPYDEVLISFGDSYANASEVIHTLLSTGVDQNFTRFTITEDTEVSVEFNEWFTSNTKPCKELTSINPSVTVNQDDSSSVDITSSSDIYYMINNSNYWVPVITSETSFPYTIDDVSSIQFKNDDSSLILSISYNDEVVKINPCESTTINITEDLEVILSIEQINKVYFTNTSDVNFINNGYDFYYQINESGSWVPIVSSVSPLPYTLDNVESIKFKNNSDVYNLVFVSTVLDIPDLSPKSESELFIIPDTDDHTTTFTFYLSIPEHEHVFLNGSCECGTIDETYTPPHEHIYINGECECGELDPNTNTGDTGDTDVKTLIIRTDNPNMSDYTNLFYYRTNLMTNYEILEVTTSSAKCITDLDTIQFKNLNKNVVMVLRYNNEVINLAYGEESEILDTSDIYLMNLQVSFDLDNDDPFNPGVGEENPDDDKDDDLGKWAEEQPLIVIVIGVAVIAVVVVLVLKKRW